MKNWSRLRKARTPDGERAAPDAKNAPDSAAATAPDSANTALSARTASETAEIERITAWLATYDADQPLVVVTIYNAYDDVLECVECLLSTLSPAVPVLLLDDASPDVRVRDTLAPLATANGVGYLRKETNRGIVDSANLAFRLSTPRDVVILNSDILLPVGWLERLRVAAYSRSNIATATPLTNNGVIYSVPYRNQPIEHFVRGMTLETIDERIARTSLHLRPVVPTAITFCTYFRRTALDAVGLYDEIFSPGYGEEVDFSQRATITGFSNIIVDDLFVFHKGSRSFGTSERKQRIQDAHEAIVRQRFPWHAAQVMEIERDNDDPLFAAVDRARGALLGYRIAVDATCINDDHVTGTQVGTLELLRALATAEGRTYTLTAIVTDHVTLKALAGVDALVDKVLRVSEIEGMPVHSFDLVHRPFQVNTMEDLQRLRRWGRRFAVSHLDCIAFSNPNYSRTPAEWFAFRRLTRLVFSLADGVAFISKDAADDAAHRGLHISPERSEVVYFGVDHQATAAPTPPANHERFDSRPFLLMLGTNFRHKNRTFALHLLGALMEQHGWDGNLVFAGPRIMTGGSNEAEAHAKLSSRAMAARVFDVGPVSDAEKEWLLAHAALVLYPSVYEGFGIVPFEAAQQNTPTLATRMTSVGEVLGDGPVFLESFDAEREAATAWKLLTDARAAQVQVAAIRERAEVFTWRKVAERAEAFYDRLLANQSRSQHLSDLVQMMQAYEHDRVHEEYAALSASYAELNTWANGLNRRVLAMEKKPFYRLLGRL